MSRPPSWLPAIDSVSIQITDDYGRRWDGSFDYARLSLFMPLTGNYAVVTEDGYPLFGRTGHAGESVTFIARGWMSRACRPIS